MENLVEEFSKERSLLALREMATRCCPTDNGGQHNMYISVWEGTAGGKQAHTPAHAYFFTGDKKFESQFSIEDDNPPQSRHDIREIKGAKEIPAQCKETIFRWATEKNIDDPSHTNWEMIRLDWKGIERSINAHLNDTKHLK